MLLEGSLLLGAYFIGSIPFGLLLARGAGLPDPRGEGSGSIGATNLLRLGGKKIAFFTLLLDALKGMLAVLLAFIFDPDLAPFVGIFVALGHVFPVWLRFHGGKGVATCFGVLLALSWPTALLLCLVWGVVAAVTRYASLASLSAALASSFILFAVGQGDLIRASLILTALIFYTHQENIQRLFSKKEFKIGEKKRRHREETEKNFP